MYKLYIANKNYSSWSLRPWVLMKELSISFEEELVPLAADPNQNSFKTFSPNGQVPCLHDGDNVIWDSLAITEYLAERHPDVWPADSAARAWARSASAEMHSGFSALRQQCPMSCSVRVSLGEISKALAKNFSRLDELWSEGLNRFGGPFLSGKNFTAVDAFFAPVAFRVQTYQIPLAGKAANYVHQLLQLPSMRQWEESALKEPWKEEAHEKEVLAAGKIEADYRASK